MSAFSDAIGGKADMRKMWQNRVVDPSRRSLSGHFCSARGSRTGKLDMIILIFEGAFSEGHLRGGVRCFARQSKFGS